MFAAARNSDEGLQEYLCKWRGLPYSESTWETSDLVTQSFQAKIDAYLERNNSDCIPSRNAKVLRSRPRFLVCVHHRTAALDVFIFHCLL